MAYIDAIGEKIKYKYSYKNGIKWADFLNDLASVIETHASSEDWIGALDNTKEWSYFAADDLVPWIISNCETAREVFKRTKRALAQAFSIEK